MQLSHILLRKWLLLGLGYLFLGISQAYSAEILMVRWFDKAEADELFIQEIKKLRPDVKIRQINARRNSDLLRALLASYDFSKTDLVHTFGTDGTRIVKEYLKGGKPIVFDAVSSPVLSELVKSIEKPGYNMTGARMLLDLNTQIEVLSEVTNLKTLGVWYDPREYQSSVVLAHLKKIADKKGIRLRPYRIIPDAKLFDKMMKFAVTEAASLDALYFIASSSFHLSYKKLHKHLPDSLITMGVLRQYVEHGSTFAIGPVPRDLVREVARRADRILKGEKAGEMPLALLTRKNAVLYVNRKKVTKEKLDILGKLKMKMIILN